MVPTIVRSALTACLRPPEQPRASWLPQFWRATFTSVGTTVGALVMLALCSMLKRRSSNYFLPLRAIYIVPTLSRIRSAESYVQKQKRTSTGSDLSCWVDQLWRSACLPFDAIHFSSLSSASFFSWFRPATSITLVRVVPCHAQIHSTITIEHKQNTVHSLSNRTLRGQVLLIDERTELIETGTWRAEEILNRTYA